jgi:DNA-binding transcriptional LysR family regulator
MDVLGCPPMELSHLRYFYEVAKAGSFTSAARHLRVSQPSLSKAVALLEARESVRLLERSKAGVLLTPIGAEVYAHCEKIFGTIDTVKSLCAGRKEVCEGPLALGSSDHLANYFLSAKIAEAKRIYPILLPTIFVGAPQEIAAKLLAKEIEFGLFFTKIKDPAIVYEPVRSFPMVAVAHPNLMGAFKGRGKARGAKLRAKYLSSIRKDFSRNPAQEVFDILSLTPEVEVETNSQELQKRLCLEGLGVAVLVRFMVEEEIRRGRLVEIPLSESHSATLSLARRKDGDFKLNARSFLKVLT